MTATASESAPARAAASRGRTARIVAVAAAAAAAGAVLLGLAAIALGAGTAFNPVQPFLAGPFAAVGTAAGIAGWVLIARRVRRSAAVLRVLVPTALVLSWIPDAVLLATGFLPGTTPLGVGALALMHVVAATAAVVAGRRIAPAR